MIKVANVIYMHIKSGNKWESKCQQMQEIKRRPQNER